MTTSQLLVMLVIAIVSNSDNIGVGISYGTRKILIPFIANLLIAFITGIGTLVSMYAGKAVSSVLDPKMANAIGAGIIIIVGIWIFVIELSKLIKSDSYQIQNESIDLEICKYSYWRKVPKILQNPFLADWDFSGCLSLKEASLLAFALTINNLANGVGAGMAGLNPFATSLFVWVFSLLTIWVGIKLGHDYVCKCFGKFASPIAGLLLAIIGIYEIFSV